MTDFSYDASRHLKKGRGKVYDSIVDTIGDTPIVRLPRLSAEYDTKATVLAKLEFFNPIASVKDRIGVAMVEALQEAGTRADPATLAGGIWEALLTTAAGMAVAIPAQIALTWFDAVLARVRHDMEDCATRVFVPRPARSLPAKEQPSEAMIAAE